MRKSTTSTLVGTSAIALLLLLSGCGTASTPTPTPTSNPSSTSTPTPTPTLMPSRPTSAPRVLAQYWVADTARGFRLYREFVRLEITPDPITAALRALVSSQPKDADYTNLWSAATKINRVKVSGNTATVDLTLGKLNVGSEAEALAIAQLVWTATAADPSVTKISLTVGGKKVESIAGHVDATKPFTRAPTYAVLAPVWITSPTEGEQKNAEGFTLRGMASTFEANVAWKVYLDGKLLKQGSTLAAEAAPAWKSWSAVISGLSPGRYLFAAMEYSAKDGSLVAKDTKNVTLK
jgi:hypothetical protein